jgi:hypothetical protein
VRGVDRKHNAHSRQLVISLASVVGTYLERQMMQRLDLLDVFLLAGSVVYFGLVVLRRI